MNALGPWVDEVNGSHFLLDGRIPIPVSFRQQVRAIVNAPGRCYQEKREKSGAWARVGEDKVGDVEVSTVFIGHDMGFCMRDGKRVAILFETMAFDANGNGDLIDRYETWEEAEIGHAKAVAELEAKRKAAS